MPTDYKKQYIKDLLKKSRKGDKDAAFQAAKFFLKEEDYKNAAKQLELATDKKFKGEPQYLLAMLYFEGKQGVKQDYKKACKLFFEAIFNGNKVSNYYYAYCNEHGLGCEKDWSTAYMFYLTAAKEGIEPAIKIVEEQEYLYGTKTDKEFEEMPIKQLKDRCDVDDPLAFYFLGLRYIDQKEYELAYKTFTRGYNAPYYKHYSLTGLGLMYLQGLFVKKDINKAFECFKEATNNDCRVGMFYLATCYEKGIAIEKDLSEAFKWYEKAASKNDGPSLNKVAYFYETGRGVEKSIHKAIYYYSKAVENGFDVNSELYRADKNKDGAYFYNLSQQFLKENNINVYKYCLDKASMYHHAQSDFELGLLYFEGKLVKQDIKKARHFFDDAYKKHHIAATYYLGVCYQSGLGCSKDEQFALTCFEYAASKGYEPAKKELEKIAKLNKPEPPKEKEEASEPIIVQLMPEPKEKPSKPQTEKPEVINFIVDYEDCSLEQLEKAYQDKDYYACSYLGDIYYKNQQYEKAHNAYKDGYLKLKDSKCALGLGLIFLFGLKEPEYEKAFSFFSKSKETAATYYKGFCYENGYGVHKNKAAAASCYRLAANLNYEPAKKRLKELNLPLAPREDRVIFYESLANADLLKLYQSGDYKSYPEMGIRFYQKEEYEKAIEAFQKGVEANGHAYCAYILGRMYYSGEHVKKDYSKAFELLSISANKDYGPAYFYLGCCYDFGYGTKQNYSEAFKWFKKSVEEENDIYSANNLGVLYRDGKGTSVDYNEAFKLFTLSAEGGNANAQKNLARMYEKGKGTKVNYKEAIKWYKKAAEQGEVDAMNSLGRLYQNGNGVAINHNEAFKWFTKSAESGDAWAQNEIGLCYYYGKGVSSNYSLAFRWFLKAAKQGEPYAQNNVGICYEEGEGVDVDYQEAYEWYKKAADNGYAEAFANIGCLFYKGNGVRQNYYKAFDYFLKAAEMGDAYGQYCLGYCCENGEGTIEDEDTAIYWYKQAARQGYKDAQDRLIDLGYSW